MGGRAAALPLLLLLASSGCAADEAGAPAQPTSETSASTVHVTCTPGTGIEVSSDVVAATSRGVRITVDDKSGRSDTSIAWGWNGQFFSGQRAGDQPHAEVPAPPGELLLSCSPGDAAPEDLATVRVFDPDGHWEPMQRPADVGCTPEGGAYYPVLYEGANEQAALDAMLAANATPGIEEDVLLLHGGYPDEPGHQFVVMRNQQPSWIGAVGPRGDVRVASVTDNCVERYKLNPTDP